MDDRTLPIGKFLSVTAQARKLVTRGVYGKIRNPIYLFGSLFIVGYILMIGRPLGLLIFIIIIPLQIWRAGKEAKVLEAKFEEEYRAYRAGTWF
jgi:protein-S-isoprenylcysteine O-methyltransferase Ste14